MSGQVAPTPTTPLRPAALRLERFLLLSRDARELAPMLCLNFDQWLWVSPEARALGREVYDF